MNKEQWLNNRRAALNSMPLKDLVSIRNELGLTQIMDPRKPHDLSKVIAEAEWTQLGIPGAVLEEQEDFCETGYSPAQQEQRDHILKTIEGLKAKLTGYPAADVAGVPFDIRTPGLAEPHWHNKILVGVDPRRIETQSADYIVNQVLPLVLEHFLSKNADYGDQHRSGLGLRAEFVGLHRKFAKLKSYFWDSKQMNHESGKEMLYDVIGACFLMLDLIDKDEEPGRHY